MSKPTSDKLRIDALMRDYAAADVVKRYAIARELAQILERTAVSGLSEEIEAEGPRRAARPKPASDVVREYAQTKGIDPADLAGLDAALKADEAQIEPSMRSGLRTLRIALDLMLANQPKAETPHSPAAESAPGQPAQPATDNPMLRPAEVSGVGDVAQHLLDISAERAADNFAKQHGYKPSESNNE